ncbi:MAG: 4Fe-4S dicluster domain-containing protein [Pseudomonadota bacterium]|nr:4Fe-4S dicluster domain-containing protein [Pseudomonadota bacterium]
MNEQLFLIDVNKCTGCGLCIVACKDEHVDSEYLPWTMPQPESGHFWINVKPLERGSAPRLKMNFLPTMCQHCESAPCIPACPEGAIKTREDGMVWIDPAVCKGCGKCEAACPYDVIYKNDELNISQKCTGCAHRIDEDEQPRCAEICPHDAILYNDGPIKPDLNKMEPNTEILHPEFEASPRVHWKGLPKPWIAGTVTNDAGDEVIANATVTATGLSHRQLVTAKTDAFGDFSLTELHDGKGYKIQVTREGYAEFDISVTTEGDKDLGAIALSKNP